MTTAAPGTPLALAPPSRHIWARLLRWGVPAVVLAGGVSGIAVWKSIKPKSQVHYETATVERGPIVAKVTATGTLSALVTVSVGSQVSGRIDALFADFETEVHKGETIATIEPSLLRAAAAQAKAAYVASVATVEKARAHTTQTEKDLVRARGLFAAGIISRADLDAAEAAAASAKADEAFALAGIGEAKAALDQAELNLRYATIASPIDGIVISRNVDVGQTVAAALQAPTLFTIAQDLTRMQVDTNVAEADIGKVKKGMEVGFSVDAYPGRTFKGTIRQVRDNATTLQNVVTYDVVIDVDNGERLLKPGMTANVTFTYASREAALRLPNAALRFHPDAPTLSAMKAPSSGTAKPEEREVWVLHGDTPESRLVTVGITDGSTTEITSTNLDDGEKAIVEASVSGAEKKAP